MCRHVLLSPSVMRTSSSPPTAMIAFATSCWPSSAAKCRHARHSSAAVSSPAALSSITPSACPCRAAPSMCAVVSCSVLYFSWAAFLARTRPSSEIAASSSAAFELSTTRFASLTWSLPAGKCESCLLRKGTTTETLAHHPSSCEATSQTPPPAGGARPLREVSCVLSCTSASTRKTSATGRRASRTSYHEVAPWARRRPLMEVREWMPARVLASLRQPLCMTTLPTSLMACSLCIVASAEQSTSSALLPMLQLLRSSETSAWLLFLIASASARTPSRPRWLLERERELRFVVAFIATNSSDAPSGPNMAEVLLRSRRVSDAAILIAGASSEPPGRPRVEPLSLSDVIELRAASNDAANLAPSVPNVAPKLQSSMALLSPNFRCRRSRMTAVPYLTISTDSRFLQTHSSASEIWCGFIEAGMSTTRVAAARSKMASQGKSLKPERSL
mmetsp:Transcript_2355/g.5478  ORF Transcript_2355/g.5478 Transcript_2355/m.5478 type:complete len:447 (+) Transcript_2355:305-1645(+)